MFLFITHWFIQQLSLGTYYMPGTSRTEETEGLQRVVYWGWELLGHQKGRHGSELKKCPWNKKVWCELGRPMWAGGHLSKAHRARLKGYLRAHSDEGQGDVCRGDGRETKIRLCGCRDRVKGCRRPAGMPSSGRAFWPRQGLGSLQAY